MSNEFLAPSGKKVVINPAPFGEVMALKSAIGRAVSQSEIDVDINAADLFNQDFNPASIAKIALFIDSDAEINSRLFGCLSRCLRDGEKITEATFEDVSAREDYYPIAFACLKENLSPFLKPLLSRLSAPAAAKGEDQSTNGQKAK